MKYIDIHCHLDFPDYGSEISHVLERMKAKEIGAITIGTDLESSKRAVEIAEQNENVWACIGVHPNETSPRPASLSDPLLEAGEGRNEALPLHLGEGQPREAGWDEVEFEKLVQSQKVVGIGECGLDYFRIKEESEKEIQKKLFIQQIEFALKHDKPLMLHCRDAYDEVLDILESYKEAAGPEASKLRGNTHFFAGSVEQAGKFLDLGFTLSFTGVITFTHDYDEVIKFLPQNSIMSETDAPFVSPVPYRGKRNEPSFVVEVVKKMAEIRGEEEAVLALAIINNAKRIFGISVK